MSCESAACAADAKVQLASHYELSNEKTEISREQLMETMMELAVENARLEAAVEAMENHMALMEEMLEVRVENAALKAQLKYMEQHRTELTTFQPVHPSTGNGHSPHGVNGLPHPVIPSSFSARGPHLNSPPTQGPHAMPAFYPVVSPNNATYPELQMNVATECPNEKCPNEKCPKAECTNAECSKAECKNR
jgi:hypothetical protein